MTVTVAKTINRKIKTNIVGYGLDRTSGNALKFCEGLKQNARIGGTLLTQCSPLRRVFILDVLPFFAVMDG